MANISISELRKKHTDLYNQARPLFTSTELIKKTSDSLNTLQIEIDSFLDSIVEISKDVILLDDYNWLGETLAGWQLIYSRIFSKEKYMELELPKNILIARPPVSDTFLSDEDIKKRISIINNEINVNRVKEHHYGNNNLERLGEINFAWEVLDGKVRFNQNISSNSYYLFENIWLTQIKELIAHFNWINHRQNDDIRYSKHKEDYESACNTLRAMLVDASRKVDKSFFLVETKAYIENRYLTDGQFDDKKYEAHELLNRKSAHICERLVNKNDNDDIENWLDAKAYIKLYYENIIPAIVEKREESILSIIKAFQFTTIVKDKLHIIDVFEVILAIYYLDAAIISKLWEEGEKERFETSYSAIRCFTKANHPPSWLEKGRSMGLDLYFSEKEKKVWFRGIMFEQQRLFLDEFCKSDDEKVLLKKIYKDSRLVKRMATL
jgi:hypothetical protein